MDFMEAYIETLRRMLKNLHLEALSPEYVQAAERMSWIMGILTAVIILVAVILSRKNIVLGVFTAVAQVASAVSMQKFVVTFLQTDFLHVEYITGSSQSQVDELVGAYQRSVLEGLLPVIIGSMIYLVAWILLLVLIIKCMKFSPKVLGVFALILNILRYMFLPPYDVFTCIFGTITEASQLKWDFLFQGAPVLVALLLLIPCLVSGLRKKPAIEET